MKLSRPVSWFLLAFGVWSWFIWVTFVKNLWNDASGLAFDAAGDPTAYFWVHLLLAVTSFLLGTAVGAVGLRGLRALRREKNPTPAPRPAPPGPTPSPEDPTSAPNPLF
ncbi:SCO4848 family membrane protein, partial [Streptomyces albidoflavus]|uniref:SCO4848 family membrane protein n=1 Tax=Streptomyces albidoflavus TaxID=1886 RepID=UPI000A41D15F